MPRRDENLELGLPNWLSLLYDIFKPVNRGLSLLAASFNLVGLTFGAVPIAQVKPLPVELWVNNLQDLHKSTHHSTGGAEEKEDGAF